MFNAVMGLTEGKARMMTSKAGMASARSDSGSHACGQRVLSLTGPDDHDDVDGETPFTHVKRTGLEVDIRSVLWTFPIILESARPTIRVNP